MSSSATTVYQCPGEPYTITRTVHLGRLASYYPACRGCIHRDETGTLAPEQVKLLAEAHRRADQRSLFNDEGLDGVYLNEVSPAIVRNAAAAFSQYTKQSQIVIAGDGRSITGELVAAAVESLRWSGCAVVDIGSASAPALVSALHTLRADGAMLIGNASGEPHKVGLKFWTADGQPISAGAGLEEIERLFNAGVSRPVRSFAPLEHKQPEAGYLDDLARFFHALRPLNFVLDTSCGSVRCYLANLTATVACRVVASESSSDRLATKRSPAPGLQPTEIPRIDRRLKALGRQVRDMHSHFGVWIDGDGEALVLIDENGHRVESEQLLLLMAAQMGNLDPHAVVVVEKETSDATREQLTALGRRTAVATSTRAAMDTALRTTGARLGGGPSGRFWYREDFPTLDALRTLTFLLTILSQSDRPLSEILAVREAMQVSA